MKKLLSISVILLTFAAVFAVGPNKNYSENDPLYLGNPTDAVEDISFDKNYLMVKPQYTLSYNSETLCPNWVAWHLDIEDIGEADRSNDFRPDSDHHPTSEYDFQSKKHLQ